METSSNGNLKITVSRPWHGPLRETKREAAKNNVATFSGKEEVQSRKAVGLR